MSTISTSAFDKALSRFRLSLTPAEEDGFKFSSLQDVHDAIHKIQQEQAVRKGFANLNRLRPFLEGMEQYGKIIEIFLNTSTILAFVWGPIKFLLLVASNMTEAFDELLEAYEVLGESIPQFQKYELLFHNEPLMGKVLELFYDDVLEFHRRALKVFSCRSWKLFFKSTWKNFGTSFKNILDNIKRHKHLVETHASLAEFEAAQISRTKIEKSFNSLLGAEKRRQLIAVTQWLAPADSNVDQERFTEIRNLYPGAGRWLLRDGTFKTWYDPLSTTGSILWLYGIPGAGKTILASLAIEEARKLPSVSVCFFYCKHGDLNKSTVDSVARGILAQLLHLNEDLLSFLYDKQVESPEVVLKSKDTLKKLLCIALENTNKVYIVIDGLDECEKAERTKILAWFMPTAQQMVPQHTRGRILFISRNEDDIYKRLSKVKKKRIESEDNSEDMKEYLGTWAKNIQQKFELTDTRKFEIISTVYDRAEGMFLFCYLVMDNLLNQTTEEELDHELRSNIFPKGLGQAYARVVERIYNNKAESEKNQAKKLLGWIVCSKRPLKWHEIQGAVSINLSTRTVDPKRRLKVTIKELCGSLVEVENDTVELVHTTAKFHLIDGKVVDVGIEDTNLATLCVQYLTFDCFDAGLSNDQVRDFVLGGQYSFQDYAVVYWISHVEAFGHHLDNCEPDNLDNCKLLDYLRQLLSMLNQHQAELKSKILVSPTIRKRLEAFKTLQIFEQLLAAAQSNDNRTLKCLKDNGIPGLGTQVQRARSELAQLASLEFTDPRREFLHSFYGPNWFKCDIPRCRFFYEGFPSERTREQHERKHRRPYRCQYASCHIAELGCSSEPELRSHLTKFHPDNTVQFPAIHSPIGPLTEDLGEFDFDKFLNGDQDPIEYDLGKLPL